MPHRGGPISLPSVPDLSATSIPSSPAAPGNENSLKAGTVSQWESIAQSFASIAPTAAPAMGVPFVLAICGNGSWLAYLLATIGIACIGREINIFARRSSSPGSLYTFVALSIGSIPSMIAGWGLLIAYIGTAAAVTGGITSYAISLSGGHLAMAIPVTLSITVLACVLAGFLAYRDVHISAHLMLLIEIVTMLIVVVLFLLPGTRSAIHWDHAQWALAGASAKQIRGGLVLAIFSFVGFESAASLGGEAINPFKTIPRAITVSAIISGVFFMLTAYAETIGFAGHIGELADSTAPLQLLANLRQMPAVGPILSIATVLSFFACTLACISAAARTLYRMSRDGHIHAACGIAHPHNKTPHIAIFISTALTLGAALVLILLHISPFDIYGWLGTIATYGFLTAYGLVVIGAAITAIRAREFTAISMLSLLGAVVIISLAVWSSFDPTITGLYHWLPYLYLLVMVVGVPVTLALKPKPID